MPTAPPRGIRKSSELILQKGRTLIFNEEDFAAQKGNSVRVFIGPILFAGIYILNIFLSPFDFH